MAAVAAPTLELTDDQKRWVVAGIALNKVVISCIRPLVKDVVEKEYEDLKKSHAIDTQTFGRHCITFPSSPAGPHFIYKNINGNESITTGRPNFDYKIQQGVDLARLCLKTHMAKFGAFDETCDGSAVLMLLGCVPSFSLATQAAANNVRSQVRNEWAHCNYNEWDETNFHNCFRYMELLLKAMGLSDAEQDLKEWETKGMTVCMSSPDQALAIRLVQEEAAKLLLEFEKVTCLAADELKRIKDALSGINEKLMQRIDQMEALIMGALETVATKEQVERVQEELREVKSALQKSGTINNLTREELPRNTCSNTERIGEKLEEVHLSREDLERNKIVEKFKAHLRQHYTVGEETVIEPLPWMDDPGFTLDNMYTEVLLIQNESNQQMYQVDRQSIFWSSDTVERPRNILIEGNPGIGKSTFCRKLAYDWAKGKIPASSNFPDFELLLKLNCREMVSGSVVTALHEQLVPGEFDEHERSVLFDYIKSIQEKVCLIFDGYDEIPATQSEVDIRMGVKRVISKKALSSCSVLVTSRQSKSQEIHKHFQRLLEIKGFVIDSAVNYIRKYYKSELLTNELISFINKNPFAAELVSSPLNTALLCIVFKENKERIIIYKEQFSVSNLYEEIVFCITKRYCVKQNIEVNDDTLMDDFRAQHLALGQRALDGLQKGQLSFTAKQMPEELHKLGFLVREQCHKATRSTKTYAFAHKSIQEYFSALYLADLLRQGESINVFEMTLDALHAIHRYDIAGLVEKSNAGKAARSIASRLSPEMNDGFVLVLLCELLSECETEEDFQETLNEVCLHIPAKVTFILPQNVSHVKAMKGLCCLLSKCVVQQTAATTEDAAKGRNPFPQRTLELQGLEEQDLTVDFVKAMTRNDSAVDNLIIMNNNVISHHNVRVIAEVIRRNTTLKCISLELGNCSEEAALEILKSMLENSTLTDFFIRGKNVGDTSAGALAKLIDRNFLSFLGITSPKIGKSGVIAIAQSLAKNTSLNTLVLQKFPKMCRQAAAHFAKSIAQNTTLRTLTFNQCSLYDKAAKMIATVGIVNNTSLNNLHIKNTSSSLFFDMKSSETTEGRIGDSGACSLAEAVNSSRSIVVLDLSFNAIRKDGAIAIGKTLAHNSVLRNVDISHNNIGDFGAKVIADGLNSNSTLKELRIAMNNIGWKGISYLADALVLNSSLVGLDLSHNNVGGDQYNRGVKAVKKLLSQNTTLLYIKLQRTGLGVSGAKAIAEGLSGNRGLKELNISENNIGDFGICSISNAVNSSSLERLDIAGIGMSKTGAEAIVRTCKTLKKIRHNCNLIRGKCGIKEEYVTIFIEKEETINFEFSKAKGNFELVNRSSSVTRSKCVQQVHSNQ